MNLYELSAKLTMDTKEYTKALDDSEVTAENKAKKIGDAFSNIGKVLTAVASTVAVTFTAKLVKDAVDAYANYEQLAGGVEKLFKTSADAVIANAEEAYKTAGMDANTYMETVTSFSASLIKGLGNDTAKAVDYADRAIVDMADNANTFGSSLESIQNAYQGFAKQNYTMLDNLKLGYGGTQEEMQKLIADASKMSDEMSELGITVNKSSMSFDNIVNAISVMQLHLGIAGTTAKEAEHTISGSIGMLKGSWENLKIAMVDSSADIGAKIDDLVSSATAVANNVVPAIESALSGIGSAVKGIANVISTNASSIGKTISKVVSDLVKSLSKSLPSFMKAGVSMILNLTEGLLDSLPDMIDSLVDGILDSLPELVRGAIQLVVKLVSHIPEIIASLIEQIPQIIVKLVSALIQAVPQLVAGCVQMVIALVAKLPVIIASLILAIPEIIMTIAEEIVKCGGTLVQAFKDIWGTVKESFDDVGNYIKNNWKRNIDDLKTTYNGLKDSIVKADKDIKAEYKDTDKYLTEKFTKAKENIQKAWDNLPPYFKDSYAKMANTYDKAHDYFLTTFTSAYNAIVESFQAGTFFADVWEKVKEPFEDAWTHFKEVGKNIVDGIKAGIEEGWNGFWQKIEDKITELIQKVKKKLGIHSPSKVFKQIGEFCVSGFSEGFEDLANGSVMDISNIANSMGAVASSNSSDNVLNQILNKMDNMGVYLDTGAMVGGLATGIDTAIGNTQVAMARGL